MTDGVTLLDDRSSPERRCRLIARVTLQILREDPDLTLCEGLRLVESAREAIERLAPASRDALLLETVPGLRRALLERFGITGDPRSGIN